MVTIVVSQLLSSPLRDHYAVLLLLPVAWLANRGRTWAAVIPLLGWLSLLADDASLSLLGTASIPLTFFGVLTLLLFEAYRERRETRTLKRVPGYRSGDRRRLSPALFQDGRASHPARREVDGRPLGVVVLCSESDLPAHI